MLVNLVKSFMNHLLYNPQETPGRKRQAPPTKDGQTGERIDTNTFIAKGGRQYHSNGSLNGTMNRTPNGKSNNGTMQFHSNPVRGREQSSSMQITTVRTLTAALCVN